MPILAAITVRPSPKSDGKKPISLTDMSYISHYDQDHHRRIFNQSFSLISTDFVSRKTRSSAHPTPKTGHYDATHRTHEAAPQTQYQEFAGLSVRNIQSSAHPQIVVSYDQSINMVQ